MKHQLGQSFFIRTHVNGNLVDVKPASGILPDIFPTLLGLTPDQLRFSFQNKAQRELITQAMEMPGFFQKILFQYILS